MLIVGAKGHAMEVYDCLDVNDRSSIAFYDDISIDDNKALNNYVICRSFEEAKILFQQDVRYIIGVGRPDLRQKLAKLFDSIGGNLVSVISRTAVVSESAYLCQGLNVMHYSMIGPKTIIGRGSLINASSTIHHDVVIGEFCEVSPGARVLGRCVVEDGVFIGSNAVILPDILIEQGAVVGAGAVVTKNVLAKAVVAGVPAKIIR